MTSPQLGGTAIALAQLIVSSRRGVSSIKAAKLRIRRLLLMSLLSLFTMSILTSCTQSYVTTKYGFEPTSTDTPVGELRIKAAGSQQKVGEREWVVKAPWRLSLALHSQFDAIYMKCKVVFDNISLMDASGSSSDVVVQWDRMEAMFENNANEQSSSSANFLTTAKDFPHQTYKLSLSLSVLGDCDFNITDHKVEVLLVSFKAVSSASLWDNLMAI